MACANPRQVTILEGVPMQAVAAMSSSSLNACNAADPNGGHAAVSGHASEHLGATELSQNLLEDGLTGIVVRTSLDLRRAFVSSACKRLLGCEPECWVGRDVADTIHLDEAGAEFLRSLRAVASGELQRGSAIYRVRHPRKHWVWVEELFWQECDVDGRVRAIVGVLRDVSERLRQADELRLAKEVAERALVAAQQASRS